MPFEKGKPKTGGRQPGSPNRFTGTFREAISVVYDGLGGHAAFLEWAKKNRSEYYRIASRLIPAEMREGAREPIRVLVYGPGGYLPPGNSPPTNPRPALLDHSTDDGEDRS